MRTSRLVVFSSLVALSLAACHHGITHTVQGVPIVEDKDGLWSRATIPADSAIRLAELRVTGGKVTKGELEEEDGRLIFSLEVSVAGKSGIEEVHVDAKTGEIVKVEHEGE